MSFKPLRAISFHIFRLGKNANFCNDLGTVFIFQYFSLLVYYFKHTESLPVHKPKLKPLQPK